MTVPRLRLLAFCLLAVIVLPGARCRSNPPVQPMMISAVRPITVSLSTANGPQGWNLTTNPFPSTPEGEQLMSSINDYRRSQNLKALSWHAGLAAAANMHSIDMAARQKLSLTNAAGVDVFQRLAEATPTITSPAGQYFVLSGSTSPDAIFNFIVTRDPGLIGGGSWTHIGIGFDGSNGGYWTVLLAVNVVSGLGGG